jgi:hypothetical protein
MPDIFSFYLNGLLENSRRLRTDVVLPGAFGASIWCRHCAPRQQRSQRTAPTDTGAALGGASRCSAAGSGGRRRDSGAAERGLTAG